MQSSLSLQVLVDYYRPWELLFYGQMAYFSQEAPVMDGSHAFGTAFGQSFAADSRFRKGSEPFLPVLLLLLWLLHAPLHRGLSDCYRFQGSDTSGDAMPAAKLPLELCATRMSFCSVRRLVSRALRSTALP